MLVSQQPRHVMEREGRGGIWGLGVDLSSTGVLKDPILSFQGHPAHFLSSDIQYASKMASIYPRRLISDWAAWLF